MGLLTPKRGAYKFGVTPNNTPGNPNMDNRATKRAFNKVADGSKVNTNVTYDQEMRNFKNLDQEGRVTNTIGGNDVYEGSGDVRSNATLKNNVNVSFDGTLGDNLKTINKLNRRNFTAAHGFRGKGWDTGMDKAEKKAFKSENPFYVKGRSRKQSYDFSNPGINGYQNNNTNYTYE